MVFQALAQYEIDFPTHKNLNLDVAIKLPEREMPINYKIQYLNALTARTAETKLNEDFVVTASGEGKATMTVMTVYNAQIREDAQVCKKFLLDVKVERIQLSCRSKHKGTLYNNMAICALTYANQAKGARGALRLKICTRYLGDIDAAMTIIDVSMLTGFAPDTEDLKRLSSGVDRYISKFEVDNFMSEKGNVIIYLDKASHTEDECLQFKVYKYFEVGFIQPGSVKVYSYYNLDEQCTKFYHPSKDTGLLNKICHENVCRCAEENCSLLNRLEDDLDLQIRIELVCKPNVDYVYKTKLLQQEEKNGNVIYFMEVVEVIKAGTDSNPQLKPRQYISQVKCKEALNLKVNNNYLVWGLTSDLWPTKDGMNYIISKNTWIERWPSDEECQDEEFQRKCNDFVQLSNTLTIIGCQT